ncbi:sulfite exporter TauE/SafE family protein [Aliiglaciecola sp. M165]|uniref:sulfite exporter TauE/SafE family protein n=1 Tax=Aliiglaciecola sp. M165 TaxID=2593649 RepID=UPI00117C0B2A|nr:sulfite exporter TauE/SafE family protein [Aliiglaciecola sp. M165]TRY29318.1 sulfite exporter TauE/SafE family protein [Aliiglaciecola sp. M165]
MLQNITATQLRLALAIAWLSIVLLNPQPWLLIVEYGAFAFLGVLGAIFANATGAGGGVVFVPFFNQLNFDSNTTVATSIAIQCCGMTAGALTWWWYYKSNQQNNADWQEIGRSLKLTVPLSILGIWLAQAAQFIDGGVGEAERLHSFFGVFSILLALSIFASIPLLKKETFKQSFDKIDSVALPLIALFGGAITAYLSIGVGELIAVYLIMRRFNVTFAIAVAVILSAFSVWAGVGFHALVLSSVYWPVVLFAGAGAIIGGMLAKYVVLYFSATNLKVFFAGWVLLLGISAMPY